MGGDCTAMGYINKCLLDTNVLISICEKKADPFSDIEKEIGKTEFFVFQGTLEEIEKLAKQGRRIERCFNLIKKIVKEKCKVIDQKGYVDDLINIISSKDQIDIIVTNDSELIDRLKSFKVKIFRMKKNGMFVLIKG
jgi:rRNA-processing protein FCF1